MVQVHEYIGVRLSTAVYGRSSSKREVQKRGIVILNRWYFKTESGKSITSIKRKIGFCILVVAWRVESVRLVFNDGMTLEYSWERRDDAPTGVGA